MTSSDLSFVDRGSPGRRAAADLEFASDRYINDRASASGPRGIQHSEFWGRLLDKIYGKREGGAKLIVDAENSALGCGKTSAAIALARHLAKVFDYELTEDDLTLSGAEYIDRYRAHPGPEQPSVLILDEAVGAGAGDARRSMAQSNLDLASAWQTARVKRVVTLVTVGHWGDMDKRMQRLSDFRLRCFERPIGKYRPYKVTTQFKGGDARTKRLDDAIAFPDVASKGDELYEALDEMKSELLDAATWDADELRDDEDEGEEEPEDDSPDLRDIAGEILEDVDEYVSVHGGNGSRYLDKNLIQLDYDLTVRDAQTVKSLVEKEASDI